MSEKIKLNLKRKRQASIQGVDKRPRLKEEQISCNPTTGDFPGPCKSSSARKRPACFSEGLPKTKRQKLRQVFSDSDKHHLLQSEKRTKEDLRLDSKVQAFFERKEDTNISYSPISSASSVLDSEKRQADRAEFLKKISAHRRLSNYDLGDVIGYGSFGQVVAATRQKDNLPVALKFVSKESVREVKEINGKRIPTEAYLQHKAKHRYVIRMYEVFTTEEYYVYVMERPEVCKDMFDILQQKITLSEKEARRYFYQILEANLSCEKNGVLHRDLKPENILVDLRSDEAKLIDFGLASEVQKTPFDGFRGTNHYTPPEFFSTGKYDGCQGTVWQLGILLVEILSPVMAFDKPEHALKMAPRIPDHLSAEAKNLISSLLNTVPTNRPTLEEVLLHPWFTTQD
ncbi:serine/threonine-protein kinase pim-1-like [Montipora capricornis]|uniref:serine/threonine-protein kinase pim-1-like n=1 Tax=Montipora foliosa TaxID=591990 RepID=UPI0035F1B287